MNRRTLLKNAIILGGGIVFMPACGGPAEEKKKAAAWKRLSLSVADEALIAEMVETLIPATDTPGAKVLEIDHFVLMMVDDCYPKDQQTAFVKGLQQSQAVADQLFHRPFEKCSTEEKIKVLQALSTHTGETGQFYKMLRELTREGYLKSKFVMTKLLPYELVPGRYNSHVLLKQPTA